MPHYSFTQYLTHRERRHRLPPKLATKVESVPSRPEAYKLFDRRGEPLYVG